MKKLRLLMFSCLMLLALASVGVEQPVNPGDWVPWNGATSYTVTFGNDSVGYYTYQISMARSGEELRCFCNECYANYLERAYGL